MDFKKELQNRIENRQKKSLLDVNTRLEHFAIISYKVPINRIQHLIPKPFKLWTFEGDGIEYALISAVSFKEKDFSFYRISSLAKLNFFQMDFRAYIIDERDGSHCVWFFRAILGSLMSYIPEIICRMPWDYGKYNFDYTLNDTGYSKYIMTFKSKESNGLVNIKNTGSKVKIYEGFDSLEQQLLILTHAIKGYYNLESNTIGSYEIWHPEMELQEGESIELYFELFEKLGLLSKEEMATPHSILITPEIEFDILLPPHKELSIKI